MCVFAYGQAPQSLRMARTSEKPMLPSPSTSDGHDGSLSSEEPKRSVSADSEKALGLASIVSVDSPAGNVTSCSSFPLGMVISDEVTIPMTLMF